MFMNFKEAMKKQNWKHEVAFSKHIKSKHIYVVVPKCSEHKFVHRFKKLSFMTTKKNLITNITKLTDGDKIVF